jgi:hypothetical protein
MTSGPHLLPGEQWARHPVPQGDVLRSIVMFAVLGQGMWWLDRLHVDIVRTRANQVRKNDQSDSLSTSTPAFSAPRPVLLGTHCRIESNTRTNLIQGGDLHDTCDFTRGLQTFTVNRWGQYTSMDAPTAVQASCITGSDSQNTQLAVVVVEVAWLVLSTMQYPPHDSQPR